MSGILQMLAGSGGGIIFIGAGAVQTGATPTVPVPSGYFEGDHLIICATGNATMDAEAGWTDVVRDSTGNARVAIIYKVAGASESSVALSGLGSEGKSVMLCYRGISGIGTTGTVATSSGSTAPATTSITTTAINELVLSVYGIDNTETNSITAPASTTERVNSGSTAGGVGGLLVVDEIKGAAGATAVRTATLSLSDDWDAIAVSFKPV